jgi:glycosyltransferase involved in cell wall biosynthesis
MSVSVVLPVHNKAWLLPHVLFNLIRNVSADARELIVVLDGCTDQSEAVVKGFDPGKIDLKIRYTDDLWEVMASNVGYKAAQGDYILTLQDDMVVYEPEIDRHMLKPLLKRTDLLGVTARNAQNENIHMGNLVYSNVAGRDVHSPRGLLQIRDVIVRGPILWDHAKLKALDYLDEDFAPIYADDYDISFRAWRKGWKVGSWMTEYRSDDAWGTTRNHSPAQVAVWNMATAKNEQLIMERHCDLINGAKHDEDVEI